MKQFLKYNFFQIVITFEIRLHAYLQNTWREDYLIKETKDPFLHGDFDSMDMFTRVTVENALLCFTAPNTKRDSDSQNDFWIRFRCSTEWLANFQPGVSTQKGPKRVWKLLPSVSGSSIKNGRSSLSWSTLIVFLRNELDTWAIAFLAKPSSTPNRSDLIDWNRMLMKVLLTMCCLGCSKLRIICQGWQPVWI